VAVSVAAFASAFFPALPRPQAPPSLLKQNALMDEPFPQHGNTATHNIETVLERNIVASELQAHW